ncbi:monooxygenase FAD-binding protein [Trametes coccinea BRFM310]|uniref:Monooxygenase FAD-binding protein n=1 Tax=Trametes coccinea (strain BRFM310) TaxID=1353009 RepID=A0A1Y2IC17_TRAC3|nr:monooxygenase FAD-binding protein [Trametes coccinea BRFM310]
MSSTQIQSPRIAIVGGGLAGLVLLLTLSRRGIPATLYERDADSNSRARLGGMLDLEWESGQRALRENGLEDAFKKNSRREAEEMKLCGKAGVPLMHRKADELPAGDKVVDYKQERPEIDRRVLRQLLLDAVPQASIMWNHAFLSARPLGGGKHELTFSNGLATTADLVVGADGANSRVRPLVSPATPIYHGVTGAEISLSPDVAALPENRDISDAVSEGSCYTGEDEKVLMFQRNGDGRIRAYAWHRNSLDWTLPEDPKEAKKVLLEIYHDWAPWMRKFIELADEEAIYLRPLFYLPVGHRWAHQPGVTLVGDAAHLMSPFAGAGANLAMLDALELGLVLADTISKGAGEEEKEAAIAKWEEGMCTRAEKVAARTKRNLESFMDPGAPQTIVDSWKRAMERAAAGAQAFSE